MWALVTGVQTCARPSCAANLRRERAPGAIHVTGNTGIDAVLKIRKEARPRQGAARPRLLVTCHRRENWRSGLAAIAGALRPTAGPQIAQVEEIRRGWRGGRVVQYGVYRGGAGEK